MRTTIIETGDRTLASILRQLPRVSRHMAYFLDRKAALHDATHAAAAILGSDVVGIFLYNLRNQELWACGTYVERKYRRRGIGTELWLHAAADSGHRANKAYVVTLTRAGRGFVERGVKPKIGWKVDHECNCC